MHKSGYAIVVTGLLTVLMISYSVSHAGQSEALIDAATRGDLKQIQRLLDGGADVNAKDRSGDTALMRASSKGHLEIVRLLLQKGADVNAKDRWGGTGLERASWGGAFGNRKITFAKGPRCKC
jgi:ankyrin repeat protein